MVCVGLTSIRQLDLKEQYKSRMSVSRKPPLKLKINANNILKLFTKRPVLAFA